MNSADITACVTAAGRRALGFRDRERDPNSPDGEWLVGLNGLSAPLFVDLTRVEGLLLGDGRLEQAFIRVYAGAYLRDLLPPGGLNPADREAAADAAREQELAEAARLLADLETPGWVFAGGAKETALKSTGRVLGEAGWAAAPDHFGPWVSDYRSVPTVLGWDERIRTYRRLLTEHFRYVGRGRYFPTDRRQAAEL